MQDVWAAAVRTTTRGASAEWSVPCGGGTRSQLVVDDEDFAKDDRMGAIAFSLGDLTPQMICAGWVRLRAFGGVASVVMRIQVDGAGQNCEGLLPTSMAEVTLPREPMTPAGSNPTATPASVSPRTQ